MTNSSQTSDLAYVLDTVAIVSHLEKRKVFGSGARDVFAAAERGEARLLVPPLGVGELYWYFSKREQLDRFRQVYSEMEARPWFQFIDLSAEQVRDFMSLESVTEMHDRIIAGHARLLRVPLVTNDLQIRASGRVETVW
ncbi:MAG: PIN domain-containing protein [Anaerolineaceae bacterium]|nr:PIN domain-containing protein [Anaerolineaceae bacterium]